MTCKLKTYRVQDFWISSPRRGKCYYFIVTGTNPAQRWPGAGLRALPAGTPTPGLCSVFTTLSLHCSLSGLSLHTFGMHHGSFMFILLYASLLNDFYAVKPNPTTEEIREQGGRTQGIFVLFLKSPFFQIRWAFKIQCSFYHRQGLSYSRRELAGSRQNSRGFRRGRGLACLFTSQRREKTELELRAFGETYRPLF